MQPAPFGAVARSGRRLGRRKPWRGGGLLGPPPGRGASLGRTGRCPRPETARPPLPARVLASSDSLGGAGGDGGQGRLGEPSGGRQAHLAGVAHQDVEQGARHQWLHLAGILKVDPQGQEVAWPATRKPARQAPWPAAPRSCPRWPPGGLADSSAANGRACARGQHRPGSVGGVHSVRLAAPLLSSSPSLSPPSSGSETWASCLRASGERRASRARLFMLIRASCCAKTRPRNRRDLFVCCKSPPFGCESVAATCRWLPPRRLGARGAPPGSSPRCQLACNGTDAPANRGLPTRVKPVFNYIRRASRLPPELPGAPATCIGTCPLIGRAMRGKPNSRPAGPGLDCPRLD